MLIGALLAGPQETGLNGKAKLAQGKQLHVFWYGGKNVDPLVDAIAFPVRNPTVSCGSLAINHRQFLSQRTGPRVGQCI